MAYLPEKDFKRRVQNGEIPGWKFISALGEREGGSNVVGEDIWRGNDLSSTPAAPASHVVIPAPADAGEQMTVISESAQDGAAGTGAASIGINYLDASGDEQTTTVVLNGTTAVDLTPSDVRFVQDMYVITLGSASTNNTAAGNIRIYKKTANTLVYNMIAAGGNKSMVPHRMVPTGKTLLLGGWTPCESQGKRCAIRLRADCTPDGVRQAQIFLFKAVAYLNQMSAGEMPLSDKIPALSVVKASAFADVTGADTSVTWWGYLVDD